MSNVIISKTTLDSIKKKIMLDERNPKGWTLEQLKEKVRWAIEEEMDRKESELDTVDKMITFLLATGSIGNHTINDLLIIDLGS